MDSDRLITPSFAPLSDLMKIFNIQTNQHITNPLVLCQKCYCHAYDQLHSKTSCQSCGAIPKACTTFNRHSPDADTVSKHLKKSTGSDITISPQDILCYNCYKLHCSILSTLSEGQEVSDDALQVDIKMEHYSKQRRHKLT